MSGPPGGASPSPAPLHVDARGLRCPLPVIRLARAAQRAPDGTVIEVWATDPAARADIPAWCRMRGQTLLDVEEHAAAPSAGAGGYTAYRVLVTRP